MPHMSAHVIGKLGFPLKKLAVIGCIALALVMMPYSYPYWPSGKMQDYALIWVKGDEISQLFALTDQLKYERVHMCLKGPQPWWVEIGGERININDNDQNFEKLKSAVNAAGLPCFWAQKQNGHWSVPGSSDVLFFTNANGEMKQTISRYYVLSQENIDGVCTNKQNGDLSLQRCTVKMFGNWYAGKELMTVPWKEVEEQT